MREAGHSLCGLLHRDTCFKAATGAGGVDGSVNPDKTTCQAFTPLLQAPAQKAEQLKEEGMDTENMLPSSSAQCSQTPRHQAPGAGAQGYPEGPQAPGIGVGAWRVAF